MKLSGILRISIRDKFWVGHFFPADRADIRKITLEELMGLDFYDYGLVQRKKDQRKISGRRFFPADLADERGKA